MWWRPVLFTRFLFFQCPLPLFKSWHRRHALNRIIPAKNRGTLHLQAYFVSTMHYSTCGKNFLLVLKREENNVWHHLHFGRITVHLNAWAVMLIVWQNRMTKLRSHIQILIDWGVKNMAKVMFWFYVYNTACSIKHILICVCLAWKEN